MNLKFANSYLNLDQSWIKVSSYRQISQMVHPANIMILKYSIRCKICLNLMYNVHCTCIKDITINENKVFLRSRNFFKKLLTDSYKLANFAVIIFRWITPACVATSLLQWLDCLQVVDSIMHCQST